MDFEKIRGLISEGATKRATALLRESIKSNSLIEEADKNRYSDEILLLEARLSSSNQRILRGEIHISEDNTATVVNLALIHVVREIEKEYIKQKIVSPIVKLNPEKDNEETEVIEITLDQDFDSFSEEDKQKFLKALAALLSMKKKDVVIKGFKRGSVKIELEMPSGKVKDLILSLLEGGLPEYKVADVKPKAYTHSRKEQMAETNSNLMEYWTRYKSGDDYALSELYRHFSPKLHMIAYRYLQDREAAKDAVQDVFLKTLPKLSSINTNIGNYLARALRNNCISINQRKQERADKLDKINKSSLKSLYEERSEFDLNAVLSRIDEVLTEEQSRVVKMTGEGFSSEEIAETIHKTKNNVRFIRHKARLIMKNDPLIKELLGKI